MPKPQLRACRNVIVALGLCVGLVTGIAGRAAEPVTASNAWVRTPAPGQKVAGAYMDLVSEGDSALIAVGSPAAARAELHSMNLDSGVMKMRQVERIDLPAKRVVTLAPGGMHIMLVDLHRPLKDGDRVPLTLTIRRASGTAQVKIEAVVRAAPGMSQHHH